MSRLGPVGDVGEVAKMVDTAAVTSQTPAAQFAPTLLADWREGGWLRAKMVHSKHFL